MFQFMSSDRTTKSIVDAINESQAVIEFDLEGKVLNANNNFLRAMGFTLLEIVGKHHRMFVEPEKRESLAYKAFWEKLKSGQYDQGQYRRRTKTGQGIWLQASYNPVLDGGGKPVKVIKFATDITAQRNLLAD